MVIGTEQQTSEFLAKQPHGTPHGVARECLFVIGERHDVVEHPGHLAQ